MSAAYDLDLFGNERPFKRGIPATKPVALSLLDFAAERAALASGRPVSQERVEIANGDDGPVGYFCICSGFIGANARGVCDRCGI
jgi:hypothetical protein